MIVKRMFNRNVAVALLLIAALPLVALADDSKISPDLRASEASGTQVQVIVQYAPGTQVSCSGLLGLVDCLLNDVVQLGGSILGDLPLINGVVALLDGPGIVSLSNQSNVVYISPDRPLIPLDVNANGAINAQFAWQSNYTGAGIGVALIDSGVNNHVDLLYGILPISRIADNQSFVSGNSSSADQYGHGTHIAGLIAGDGLASTGPLFTETFKGVAPGAKIVNLRVLDENGAGTDSEVIAAINQAISMKSQYNIRVMNLSLGRAVFESYQQDPLCQAVEQAWKNGIVVVVAAGNNGRYLPTQGYGTITAPGNDPYVITVGAMKPMGTPTRTDDLIASYSSKGPTVIDHIVKPDIVAPGNLLISTETPNTTLYTTDTSNQIPYSSYMYIGSSSPSQYYYTLSGTSMATGMVSGAVADLLQAQPRLTPDQVKARLMQTAYKTFPQSSSVYDPVSGNTYVSQYDVFTVGAGYLDLEAALQSTAVANGSAMSPTAVYNSSTGMVSMSSNSSSVWGTSAAWSGPAVWGSTQFVGTNSVMWGAGTDNGCSVMWGASALWGSSVMWGASSDSGFSTIWSNSVMWGASGDWSSSVMWGASAGDGE
jgi:serine protease AprX